MFTENELKAIEAFREEHSTTKQCYAKKKTSAKYKITLTATGIGDNIIIKCCCCGKKKDISDYERW